MRFWKHFFIILVFTLTGVPLANEGYGGNTKLDNTSKKAIEAVVRDYLIANPEIIEQAIQALQVKREAEKKDQARAAIAKHIGALNSHPLSPVSGNTSGDVSVVEFFDYQCGYCKSSLEAMIGLLRSDKKARVVWKELPILGPASRFAARAAMAAKNQGKYFDFHMAVMRTRGRLTEQKIMSVAQNVGLDAKRLREDMKDPAIDAYLEETRQLATALGIKGTPAFVIGDNLVPGALDESGVKTIIAKIRRGD